MKNKIKNLFYAIPLALALSSGCSDDYPESRKSAENGTSPLVSLENLTGILGNRWESLSEESKHKFGLIWDI